MKFALSDLPKGLQEQAVRALHPKTFPAPSSSTRCQEPALPQGGETISVKDVTWTAYRNWTLPYPPSANNYWRSIVIGGRGRVVVSREAKAFKKAVSAALAGVSPMSGHVALTATFYRPRKRGDLDNLAKVLGDALNGIAYHDDDQIVELHAYRKDDKERPRVEISVVQVSA